MTYTLNARDIPTLIGARHTPSVWEIWHQKKGTFESPRLSSRGFWRRKLHPVIVKGLEERYSARLLDHHDHFVNVGNEIPISTRGLTEIVTHGNIPVDESIRYIKIIPIGSQQWMFDWKSGLGTNIPVDIIAELHPIMAHLGASRIAVFAFVDGGGEEEFIPLSFDPDIWKQEQEQAARFVGSLLNDEEPTPDFQADGALIQQRFVPVADSRIASDDPNLERVIRTYREGAEKLKAQNTAVRKAEKENNTLKAEIIHNFKDANWLDCGPYSLNRTVIQVKESIRDPYSYSKLTVSARTTSRSPDRAGFEMPTEF